MIEFTESAFVFDGRRSMSSSSPSRTSADPLAIVTRRRHSPSRLNGYVRHAKIDRSFVGGLDEDLRVTAVLPPRSSSWPGTSAWAAAEGIETGQRRFLARLRSRPGLLLQPARAGG
jgi:hypothetical protein